MHTKLTAQLIPVILSHEAIRTILHNAIEEFFYGNIFMKADLNEKRIELYERKLSTFSYYAISKTLDKFTKEPNLDASLHNILSITEEYQQESILLLSDVNFVIEYCC